MKRRSSKSKNTHTEKGLRLALLFCILVVGIIIFSGVIRAGIAVRGSQFSDFRYNILVAAQKPQIVSISKADENYKLRVISFENSKELESFSFPINSRLESSESISSPSFKSSFVSELFKNKNNIPFFDKLKIAFFVLGVSSDETMYYSSQDLSQNQIQGVFKDSKVSDDGKSIQIINSSGISGLGNRLANDLTTAGANVVLVTSDDKIADKSVIKYREESTTTNFLKQFLGFDQQKQQFESVADVIIILGKDSENTTKF